MLSVLTLNAGLTQVRLFNWIIWEAVQDCESRIHRIMQGITKLDPDIVCLQEVYQPAHRKLLRTLTQYPYMVCYPSHGNVIMSKYPVHHSQRNVFTASFWFERLYTFMGFVHTIIKLPEGNCCVSNIHTTCGASWYKWDSVIVKQVQKLQLSQLLNRVSRHKKSIVCGDFNAGPDLNVDVYNLMHAYTDACAGSKEPTWSHENVYNKNGYFSKQPSCRIDHIFVSKQFKVKSAKIVMKNGESDHYGVLARLE